MIVDDGENVGRSILRMALGGIASGNDVPEPSAIMLALLALAGVAWRRRLLWRASANKVMINAG